MERKLISTRIGGFAQAFAQKLADCYDYCYGEPDGFHSWDAAIWF